VANVSIWLFYLHNTLALIDLWRPLALTFRISYAHTQTHTHGSLSLVEIVSIIRIIYRVFSVASQLLP